MKPNVHHWIRKITMAVMIGFGILGGLFAGGYAWEDEGFLRGSLMVASYAVPMIVVSWLAWRRSAAALPLIVVATLWVVATSLLDASDPMRWGPVWDRLGPVLAISGFAVSVVLAVYGYRQRARLAGALLVAATGIPLFAGVIMGTQEGPLIGGSTSAGVLPGLIAGIIYLVVGDDN